MRSPRGPTALLQPGARGLSAVAGTPAVEDVGARLADDLDTGRVDAERARHERSDGGGGDGEQAHPGAPAAVDVGEDLRYGATRTDDGQAHGHGAVEVHPLERAAVPQLDHEGAAGAEPAGVAEAMGEDDDPSARRCPERGERAVISGSGLPGRGRRSPPARCGPAT